MINDWSNESGKPKKLEDHSLRSIIFVTQINGSREDSNKQSPLDVFLNEEWRMQLSGKQKHIKNLCWSKPEDHYFLLHYFVLAFFVSQGILTPMEMQVVCCVYVCASTVWLAKLMSAIDMLHAPPQKK